MRHARFDYERFQDPLGKIPEDEPVMLFRGQDALAADVVEYYAWRCRQHGLTDIAVRCEKHAKTMRAWPTHKLPDVPPQ